MAAALPPMLILVNSTPDRIPADVIAEQQAAEEVEQKDKLEKEVMTSRVQEV
jgi:hypothetical protein